MHVSTRTPQLALAASLTLVSGSAFAHSGDHTLAGFTAGFAHPFSGLDHLLAMLAVGLWAARQGGHARWALPAAFLAAALAGVGWAAAGGVLPALETGLALSVLLLGLLVATRGTGLAAGVAVAAGFAVFHGYTHGIELAAAPSMLSALVGFVLASASLHLAGLGMGIGARRLLPLTGFGIAASGCVLLLGA